MAEKEYIEREALCYQLAKQATIDGQPRAIKRAAKIVAEFPAADVRPVVRAHWVDNHVAFYRGCPECGAFVRANLDEVFLRDFPSAVGKLNFCPNCGADMREES